MMDAVASWDGGKANLLREALRMTNEQFASHLGISDRTVAYWRRSPSMTPLPATQEILDTALTRANDQVRAQFHLLMAEKSASSSEFPAARIPADDLLSITEWVRTTNTDNGEIAEIDAAAVSLAETHVHAPPQAVLGEVLELQRGALALLVGGKQRLRQTRELMRINSNLLAHACVLLGDVGQERAAASHGRAAQLFAHEAEVDEAIAWSVRSKTARWLGKYVEAADMARHGFDVGRFPAVRLELAYRESLTAALLGDVARSRDALTRAEKIADTLLSDNLRPSVWSFPAERQAVFDVAIAICSGDPDTALDAVAMADAGWSSGDPRNPANWAQIRIGAGMAHLMNEDLDRAAEQVNPVLDLHPNLRIGTVTGYMRALDRRLDQPRFNHSRRAAELRQSIREFNARAMKGDARVEAQ
jgi:hypothetical protein